MNKIQIYVDALCDISDEEMNEMNIQKLPYLFEIEEKEYLSSELNSEQIYEYFKKGTAVKTSRPALGIWEKLVRESLSSGYDIFYVASTTKMTGAMSSFKVIQNLVQKDFPNSNLYCFDTSVTTAANNILSRLAYRLFEENKSVEEVVKALEEASKNAVCSAVLDSTHIMVANNRISETSVNYPVVLMKDGILGIDKQFVSREECFNYVLDELKTKVDSIQSLILSYSYDQDKDEYDSFKERVKEVYKGEIIETMMQSTMYTYLSIRTIGVSYF